MTALEIGTTPRILVIALRRIGDVLLTTPLIRSMRNRWPQARIDALVFADTAGILTGNPEINQVIAMPERPNAVQSLALAARLCRRYTLAVSTQAGDRPIFFAWLAGRRRVGPITDDANGRLKRLILNRYVPVAGGLHRVEEILRIADTLGVPRAPRVVGPRAEPVSALLPNAPYAVVHAAPMFRYKQWTLAGWRDLATELSARGLAVVATGGPGAAERRYLDELWATQSPPVVRLDARLSWAQLTHTLGHARLYIGPDTSVTHLAAASGCPTVALYGPTDPRLWGPWPAGGLTEAWTASATVQQRGNVWLVQNPLPCMPCQLEGCERRIDGPSACLDELPLAQVLAAVDAALKPAPV